MQATPDIKPDRGGWFFGIKLTWPWNWGKKREPDPSPMPEEIKFLKGDGTWPFACEVHGRNLVVKGKFATWFGGTADPHDNGQTASGISTRKPGVLGCALPMDIGARFKPTHGSPIPKLPYRTTFVTVRRRDTGAAVRVPLIDIGPAKKAAADGDVIDLTPATFAALGVKLNAKGNPVNGRLPVDFTIENAL